MREHIEADEPFVREDVQHGRRAGALPRRGPGLQGRADRGPRVRERARRARPSRFTPTARSPTCAAGPHAPTTKRIKAFKLQSVAGAYWRGDASKPMLTRVYGTAFFSPKDLEEHLERLERARANDHRRLGPQLGLFTFSDVAPGAAFWLPAGTEVFNSLVGAQPRDGPRARLHRGQDPAAVRQLAVEDLRALGQVPRQHVRDRVRGPGDGAQADELPGALPAVLAAAPLLPRPAGALLRARTAAPPRAQRDAARAACGCATSPRTTRTSSAPRIRSRMRSPACLEFAFATYAVFGLDVRLELSTRPEERIGSDELWDRREAALTSALESQGLEYDAQRGRRRLLRPEDRHAHDRLARPLVAARHRAARLQLPRALRPRLHRRGQRRAPAGDDPPGA